MTIRKNRTIKETADTMGTKKKAIMGAVGLLALTGLGVGAAHAATPPAPHSAAVSVTADTQTPGDTPDAPGAADTQTPGDTPDAPAAGQGPQTTNNTNPANVPSSL